MDRRTTSTGEAIAMQEESIFIEALEKADPAERAAFLDRACAGDEALRQRIERLLARHGQPDSFLDAPATDAGATVEEQTAEDLGAIIGPYKLLQPIGEGGMGTVYMAEQRQPVKRMVALKVIKPGMDSRQVLARFEAERQALALMDHPNIAKVLDAGTTPPFPPYQGGAVGRPYFVMELVKGVPITRFCDERRLTPRERLELVIPVCQAVQHAHQKGVIHRDLKPSNVLIALYDGRPVPKVIDFGVAKATGPKLTDRTLYTEFGSVVGTLEYMSPEQAELNQLDIDTRSDIYSMGVLLYELLTGTTPLQRGRIKQAAILEALRLVREEESPRPSLRLWTTEELPSIAACRGTEPRKLSSLVRGELDWIVMKALEKDRDRRYETANGLARDLQRYLADEVVEARPPSTGYRLRKFVRRHKGRVLAAAVVVVALVAGTIGTTWGYLRAERARQAAARRAEGERLAKLEAQQQKAAAEAATAQAQQRLRQIEKGNELLTRIFIDLDIREVKKGAKPLEAVLAERLVKAAEQLAGDSVGDPLIVAMLQDRLGGSLLSLGFGPQAIPVLERARATRETSLGPDHPDTLAAMNHLAQGYDKAGKLDRALPLLEETLRLRKAKFGPDHPDTLGTTNDLALGYRAAGKLDLALSLLQETLWLSKAKLGPDHSVTLISMNSLAASYLAAGKLDLALPLCEENLRLHQSKLGPDHPDTLTAMNNLALGYEKAGKLVQALPLQEQTVRLMKSKLGPDHPDTLTAMNNLAAGYRATGKLERALPLDEETLGLCKAKLGPDHPDTLTAMANLAADYLAAGKLNLALPLFEETLRLRKSKLGPAHPDTLGTMINLAVGYQADGKFDRALPLEEESLRLMKSKLGPDHPDTLGAMQNLASGYYYAGKLDQALPLFEENLRLLKAKLGLDHPRTLAAINNVAAGYQAARKLGRALPLFEENLRLLKSKLGPDHPGTLAAMHSLASGYVDAGKLDQALPLFEETLRLRKAKLGPAHPDTLATMHNLASGYWRVHRLDQSIPLFEETLKTWERTLGRHHPSTMQTLASLGGITGTPGDWPRPCRSWRRRTGPAAPSPRSAGSGPTWSTRTSRPARRKRPLPWPARW
jgi:serine/threonine protein kinase/tetratricopeptide (TPR) repeat protein